MTGCDEIAIVLDCEVTHIDPEFPNDVRIRLVEPCPFCGIRHTHTDNKTVKVGTLLHRSAHCVSDKPPRKRLRGVAPDYSYWLRVVSNPFSSDGD